MNAQTDNSIGVIQPLGENVTIVKDGATHNLNIQEFFFGDIGVVVNLVAELGVEFTDVGRDDIGKVAAIFGRNTEKVYQVLRICIASELKRIGIEDDNAQLEWIKSLRGQDGVRLAFACFKVNYDFFFQSKELFVPLFPTLAKQTTDGTMPTTEAPADDQSSLAS